MPADSHDPQHAAPPLAAGGHPKMGFLVAAVVWLALFAGVVLAIAVIGRWAGVLTIPTEPGAYEESLALVEAGRFDEAEQVIADAEGHDISSSRLLIVHAQALRHIPNINSLAHAGTLSDFGYDLRGTGPPLTEDPERISGVPAALNVLQRADERDVNTLLNRAHAYLTQRKPEQAVHELDKAARIAPRHALVYLGMGIAQFQASDPYEAVSAFTMAVQYDLNLISARINLAVAFEESDLLDDAIGMWESVLVLGSPTEEQRAAIEQRIADLTAIVRPQDSSS